MIVARNPQGETAVTRGTKNVHRRGILHVSIVPARVAASSSAGRPGPGGAVGEGLDVVGVLGVELFLDGEAAVCQRVRPRPHNSGHYTIEACVTSQFEQHVRSVCGCRWGRPALKPAVVVNLLGQHMPRVSGLPDSTCWTSRAAPARVRQSRGPAGSQDRRRLTMLADTLE